MEKIHNPPPPKGGQSYCAFVFGEGGEVKEDDISLKDRQTDRQADIVVYREVTLKKMTTSTHTSLSNSPTYFIA